MGYRIFYGPAMKAHGAQKRISRVASLTGLFFLMFLIALCCFWPEGVSALRRLALPGDPAVTVVAMDELTDSLRMGEKVWDSLESFCIRILEGAALDSSG